METSGGGNEQGAFIVQCIEPVYLLTCSTFISKLVRVSEKQYVTVTSAMDYLCEGETGKRKREIDLYCLPFPRGSQTGANLLYLFWTKFSL